MSAAYVYIVFSGRLLLGAYTNPEAAQDHVKRVREKSQLAVDQPGYTKLRLRDSHDIDGWPWGATG
jgi:hypothetical protein